MSTRTQFSGNPSMSLCLLQDFRQTVSRAAACAILCLAVAFQTHAQQPATSPLYGGNSSTPPSGGSATAGVFAPVLDSEKRPITAGGFVKTGPIVFQDVSEKAGLTLWHHKMGTPQKTFILETTGSGACLLDYDHDGWLDIYLVNGSTYEALDGKAESPHAALFHNNRDGTFTDISAKAGVTNDGWGYGCAVGDYDNDGWPDLYVTNYGKNRLYHNNHDGTFTDVSEKAGVSDKNHYYGFSSTFVDVNDDGKVDLIVADDSTPNYLYINKGNGTFEDASFYSGFALNQDARETASMGLGVGDYLNNGRVDLYTTTFSDDYKTLFRNEGDGNFSEITPEVGIAEVTYPFLSWATEFIDYDNDGWKDIMSISGHVYPQVDQHNWGTTFAERPMLFHNMDHGNKFEVIPAVEGTGLADVIPGRGAAFGDLFNNGKIDVVVNCIDHTPVLLRNVNADTNHWVGLALIGGPKGPRDANGTKVYLTSGGTRQRGDVMSGGSYESSNDQRLHFGLGQAATVDAVEIRWSDGTVENITLPGIDRFFMIEEGKGIVPSVYDDIAKASGTKLVAK
jgi:hypothetical protein